MIQKLHCPRLERLAIETGSAKKLLSMNNAELQKKDLSHEFIELLNQAKNQTVEAELEWQEKQANHHLICWEDSRYPSLLREIHQPPALLYIRGDPDCIQSAQIAIVGSRQPSPMGIEFAKEYSQSLSELGIIITSGLALGIDGASHSAALAVQARTIAILGSGLDLIYPRKHLKLADKICENGALISEYSPQMAPLALHFPQRNRIISGLSYGVLVIEASLKSGSLITARLANEQGREVFAIPGSPHHKLAAGCNRLIQQGAKLVSSVEDIIEELRLYFPAPCHQSKHITNPFNELELDGGQQKLLECIGFELSSFDQIVARSGLTPEYVCPLLTELELLRLIKIGCGGYIRNSALSKANKPELTDKE